VLLVFEPKLKQTGGNRPITFPLAAVVLVSLSPSLSTDYSSFLGINYLYRNWIGFTRKPFGLLTKP
jgi:hypothetical protein